MWMNATPGLGVGLAEGEREGEALAEPLGEAEGLALGENPAWFNVTAKACLSVSTSAAVMSITPVSPIEDQSQWPKVCEKPERAVPSS